MAGIGYKDIKKFCTYKLLSGSYLARTIKIFENIALSNKIVLDMGCGRGEITLISSLKSKLIIGCDISIKDLLTAKENAKKGGRKNAYFVLCDINHLPFKKGVFDAGLCIEVLQYLEDEFIPLKEIRRVVKKDSEIVLSVPNSNFPFLRDPISYFFPNNRISFLKWGDVLRLYNLKDLTNMIKKQRFKIKKICFTGHFIICLVFFDYISLFLNKVVFPKQLRSAYLEKKRDVFDINQKNKNSFVSKLIFKSGFPVVFALCKLDEFLFKKLDKSVSIVLKC